MLKMLWLVKKLKWFIVNW